MRVCMCMCVHVRVCIYIYIYIYICIYVYISVHLCRLGETLTLIYVYVCAPNLPTSFVDFRGFWLQHISKLRGGIPRPIGNFAESLSQAMLIGVMLVGGFGVCVYVWYPAKFCMLSSLACTLGFRACWIPCRILPSPSELSIAGDFGRHSSMNNPRRSSTHQWHMWAHSFNMKAKPPLD